MTFSLWIIGAGGFGREVEQVVKAINDIGQTWEIEGFLDDAPNDENRQRVGRLGYQIRGSLDILMRPPGPVERYVIGIADVVARKRIDQNLSLYGWKPATLVHPKANLGDEIQLGPGTVVCAGVSATTNVRLGRHVQVNPNSTLGHDVIVHDHVTICPLASISGTVEIGARTFIGTCACVLPNLTIGESTVIGAGAVVVSDVENGTRVKGVPAR